MCGAAPCEACPVGLGLKVGKPLLKRADGPATFLLEEFRRHGLGVQRADVAELYDFLALVLFQPAQRKPLGSADVGACGVDAATPVGGEKGASSDRSGTLGGEKAAELGPDTRRFDFEDGQVVCATAVAAAAALQAVLRCYAAGQGIDFRVEGAEPLKEMGVHASLREKPGGEDDGERERRERKADAGVVRKRQACSGALGL